MNDVDEQYFWSNVDRRGPVPPHAPELGECWVWTGTPTSAGYGDYRRNGVRRLAHRIAWELEWGAIENALTYHGTCVLHRCDNPRCVRASHLFLGSQRDNIRDGIHKGRIHTGFPDGTRARPEQLRPRRGEGHWKAKFTESDIRSIRSRLAAGATPAALSREYGVEHSTLRAIRDRKTWRHVQ